MKNTVYKTYEINWSYTHRTDKAGRMYLVAYKNKWDRKLKQSRRDTSRHVGRILPDGLINFCEEWIKDYPEYAQGNFYYELNEIVTRTEKQIEQMKNKSEHSYRLDYLQVGLTLGMWRLAKRLEILKDLVTVFGEETGKLLLQLGIYQLDCPGGSLMEYEDWVPLVYLPEANPIDLRRISEHLGEITQEKIDEYFKLRHQRALEKVRENKNKSNPRAEMALAIDSTSISTYSDTINDAAYGHAKQNPELKQINLTFACDYQTGDVLYAYESEGSINDKTSFPEILFKMGSKGFDLSKTILVTDRGYSSMHNVQKQLDTEQMFVQGIALKEEAVRRIFDKCKLVLQDPSMYSSKLKIAGITKEEIWQQVTQSGSVKAKVYLHLYYDEELAHDQKQTLLKTIDEMILNRQNGLLVDKEKWNVYGKYLKQEEKRDKEHKKQIIWKRDDIQIRKTLQYAGCYAIRSNVIPDAFESLELYRRRNIVEQAFNQYKNQTEASRLHATQTTYMGRLFIHIIAQSLRMTVYMNAKNASEANVKLKLPGNSLTKAFAQLRTIIGVRSIGSNHWIMRQESKKQRDLLALLNLDLTESKNRILTH